MAGAGALAGVPAWYVPPCGDFREYCCPEPWPEDHYEHQRLLATAIHGEVGLYRYGEEELVVKKMPNKRVAQLARESCEDARVEIGVSAFLAKQRSDLVPAVENVVEMRGAFQDAEHTYFVTEFAPLGELLTHLDPSQGGGRLPEPLARRFAEQLFRGAASLHALGVAHRDISLENVLLRAGGSQLRRGRCLADALSACLVDFGQAVPVYGPMGRAAAYTGAVGKPAYRAPEQYAGAYEARPVDVFALGVVLFSMVVGTLPWSEATPRDPAYKFALKNGVGAGGRSLVQSWAPHLSAELRDLLDRLLAPRPGDRPELRECLQHAWFADAR